MRTHIIALALLASGAAHMAHAQSTDRPARPTNGDVSGGAAHEPTRGQARTLERKAGIADPNAAAQNRELDQIGKKLLRETPRNAPNTDPSTGGTLVPPR